MGNVAHHMNEIFTIQNKITFFISEILIDIWILFSFSVQKNNKKKTVIGKNSKKKKNYHKTDSVVFKHYHTQEN